ncbi:MAG: membrane protein insertion efficiency factor YidD [Candidatus Zixiibacteriota bacterium]
MKINGVSIFAYPLLLGILVYRYTLSPLLGQECRFYPTCSRYAETALKKHGALQGVWLAAKRICRCHPWHDGGYDPVPGSDTD